MAKIIFFPLFLSFCTNLFADIYPHQGHLDDPYLKITRSKRSGQIYIRFEKCQRPQHKSPLCQDILLSKNRRWYNQRKLVDLRKEMALMADASGVVGLFFGFMTWNESMAYKKMASLLANNILQDKDVSYIKFPGQLSSKDYKRLERDPHFLIYDFDTIEKSLTRLLREEYNGPKKSKKS